MVITNPPEEYGSKYKITITAPPQAYVGEPFTVEGTAIFPPVEADSILYLVLYVNGKKENEQKIRIPKGKFLYTYRWKITPGVPGDMKIKTCFSVTPAYAHVLMEPTICSKEITVKILGKPKVILWVYVYNEERKPVEGAKVDIYDENEMRLIASRTTDKDGKAVFKDVLNVGENYVLKVYHRDYEPSKKYIKITDYGVSRITVILKKPKYKLTVKVLDEQGKPIPYATVSVKEGKWEAKTDKKGVAVLELPEGKYTLYVYSENYLPVERQVTVPEDKEITIVLKKAPQLPPTPTPTPTPIITPPPEEEKKFKLDLRTIALIVGTISGSITIAYAISKLVKR